MSNSLIFERDQLRRERDEARAEVERLRGENHALRGKIAATRIHLPFQPQHALEQLDGREEGECLECRGTGERVINPDWPSGDEPYSEKCPSCGGTGEEAS